MSAIVDADVRAAFAALADVLIPEAEGMPSASRAGVHEEVLDRILGLRADLREAFLRGARSAVGEDPKAAIDRLNREDPEAFEAIGTVAAAGYYMLPGVRALIGYPGQESRPAEPEEEPEYVRNGMLRVVIDRGPIYRRPPSE